MQKANPIKLKPTAKPFSNRPNNKPSVTEQISSKMTSPTLVEFRNHNSQLPEWRLQLQNAVQQRMKADEARTGSERPVPVENKAPEPGAPAAEPKKAVEASSVKHSIDNKYLNNALKRIERSRSRYLVAKPEVRKPKPAETAPKKDYPFTIASRTENPVQEPEVKAKAPEPQVKPKLVAGKKKKAKLIKDLYDTSELDPKFAPASLSSSFSARASKDAPADKTNEPPKAGLTVGPATAAAAAPALDTRKAEPEAPEAKPAIDEPVAAEEMEVRAESETAGSRSEFASEEIDDYAPFSLRFNAGCFDFLVGSFLSFVLLLPFIAAGGEWFTFSGALAFGATCSIVMFIYLTASVGFAGKSFGMHLFSLEVIDIGGEHYPTLHQSAVSAVVYLLSTVFLGIGFVTSLFDEDRRAAHDLLSGTLVVREL